MDDRIEYVGSNPTDTTPFAEIVNARLSRRKVLAGGLGAAAASMLGAAPAVVINKGSNGHQNGHAKLGFKPIPPSTADEVTVPFGYTATVLLPWGASLVDGNPGGDPAALSAAEQGVRVGQGHDGMHYFPTHGPTRGVLVVNHEFTNDDLLTGKTPTDENWTAEDTLKSQNAHGLSIVEVERDGDAWAVRPSSLNRRVTGNTPITLSGPAAGHVLLRTAADPAGNSVLGTLNNCAMGVTPWGTYLACEENFNGYFWVGEDGELSPEDAFGAGDPRTEAFNRYGLSRRGFGYRWAMHDDRFRADLHPNEPNRFGWVVEVDPTDPTAKPVKRTALGRVKHEGATVTTGRGNRVVVYTGDDERFDYIYKFVGSRSWQSYRGRGSGSPLDDGTLYVAKFHEDGTGEWMPLIHGEGPLTEANGFADEAEVLIHARLAADRLGATPMDRPEWIAVDPRNNDVYCTLTNNTRRGAGDTNPMNPRGPNPWGHIIRWSEAGGDNAALTFDWDIFLLAGPGDGVDGSTIDSDDAFGSPDGLFFDRDGRLWIQTDGSQPGGANDQMLAGNPNTGELRRFLTGVPDSEVTGVTVTPDQKTMFVGIQHPGDGGGSLWPFGVHPPRPAIVVVTKDDGGRVGT